MAYETKPGQGSLFKNDKKTEEKHPQYRGNGISPNGEEMQISAWVKKDKNGNSYMSLSFQPPYKKEDKPEVKSEKPIIPEANDDLPF
jgi:hypothetical protein